MNAVPVVADQFLAEAYAGDARTTVYLGGALVASPRRALRWLRWQAERLANGLDPDPGNAWFPAAVLRPVPLFGADVPTELRAWAADDERQGNAVRRLAAGSEVEFVARDETGWYGVTARPLLIPASMQKSGALISA
ncbi:hypothetical protein [Streptomyces sp. DT171]|uniref:hypothetical protein n=1 Tax=Streptomyces sp. DT171 TaxID=3416524 RepID=UPI003CF5A18F